MISNLSDRRITYLEFFDPIGKSFFITMIEREQACGVRSDIFIMLFWLTWPLPALSAKLIRLVDQSPFTVYQQVCPPAVFSYLQPSLTFQPSS